MPDDFLYIRRFSLPKLAEITGYNYETLRRWNHEGWLLPISVINKQKRFTLFGLEQAEQRKSQAIRKIQIPVSPSMEERIKKVFGDD